MILIKPKRITQKHCFETTNFNKIVLVLCFIFNSYYLTAQQVIKWVDFEDLPLLQAQNSKPMFIYIYADWCVYCKKMDRVSFKDKSNVEILNEDYYALKFNIETEKSIRFQGYEYLNQELKTKRQPVHDLAKFLTGEQDQISLPAIVLLDEDFKLLKRLHTYLSPKQLFLSLLN